MIKNSKKYVGLQKQEKAIQDLIEQNNILKLSKLLSGRGTGKLVMSFPTSFAMEQWLAKMKVVASGKLGGADGDIGHNRMLEGDAKEDIIYKGILEKAARKPTGEVGGWRKRFFILGNVHLAYFTKPGGEKKGVIRVLNGGVRRMSPLETGGKQFCLELEEGRDISQVSPDLLEEARRRVRLAKILEIEAHLKLGIAQKSAPLLSKMLGFAKSLGVMLDYALMSEAKACLTALRESSIKKDLYKLAKAFPKSTAVVEVLELAETLNVDPNSPSLKQLKDLVTMTEFDQDVFRAKCALQHPHDYDHYQLQQHHHHPTRSLEHKGIVPILVQLHRAVSTQPTHRKKKYFLALVLQTVGVVAVRAHGRQGLPLTWCAQLLRQAIQLCAALRMEVEVVDLTRVTVKFLARLITADAVGADIIGGSRDLRSLSSDADLNTFLKELEFFPGQQQQYRITKYPFLRASVDKKAGILQTLKLAAASKSKEIMSFSTNAIAKSLLKYDKDHVTIDSAACLEMFMILQVLMGDRVVSSLPRPNQAKIANQSPRTAETLFFQLINCLTTKYQNIVDEFYFQLCKQLTDNPSQTSESRGWLLFTVFLHVLSPSRETLPFLVHFVQEATTRIEIQRNLLRHQIAKGINSDDAGGSQQVQLDRTESMQTAIKYTLYLLRSVAGDSKAIESHNHALLHLEPALKTKLFQSIFEHEDVAVNVVLMTGQVVPLRLTYGVLFAPHEVLKCTIEQIVPWQTTRYIKNHALQFVTGNNKGNDAQPQATTGTATTQMPTERLLNEIEQYYDQPDPSSASSVVAGAGEAATVHLASADDADDVLLLQQLTDTLLKGFCLCHVDETVLNEEGKIDLNRFPIQTKTTQMVNWQEDLQWQIWQRFVHATGPQVPVNSDDDDDVDDNGDDGNQARTILTMPTFALRRKILDTEETFLDEFHVFADEFSDREQLQRAEKCRAWLEVTEEDGLHILPEDFVRVDLVFAEDTRYVNSRLALLSTDSFHYLLALQLALCWNESEWEHMRGTEDGNDPQLRRRSHRVQRHAAHYNTATQSCHRLPSHLLYQQFVNSKQLLQQNHPSESVQNAVAALDETESLDSDAVLRHLEAEQRHYEADSHSSSSSSYVSVEEDQFNLEEIEAQRLVWKPRPIKSDDQELTTDDLEFLLHLLASLNVDESSVQVDRLWPLMAGFHKVLVDSSLESLNPRYRYWMKRAYHDYLVAVCSFYGDHFVSTTLLKLDVDNSVRQEQEGLVHFTAEFDAREVLLGISLQGIKVLDASDWSLYFTAAFWDIIDYDFEYDEDSGDIALLEINVNGLKLLFEHDPSRHSSANNGLGDALSLIAEHSREALARGHFPCGSAQRFEDFVDASGGAAIQGEGSAWEQEQIRRGHRALQAYLCHYSLLPVPPAVSERSLRRAFDTFAAPPSRREIMAQERNEEERMEQELAKLALEAQLEKAQQLLTEGREAVHRKRGVTTAGSAGQKGTSGEEEDEEEDEEDEEDDEPQNDNAHARKKKSARRKNRSVFTRHRGAEEVGLQIQRDRVTSMVCGVAPKESVFKERYIVPPQPTRQHDMVRFTSPDDPSNPSMAIAEERAIASRPTMGRKGASLLKPQVAQPVAKRERVGTVVSLRATTSTAKDTNGAGKSSGESLRGQSAEAGEDVGALLAAHSRQLWRSVAVPREQKRRQMEEVSLQRIQEETIEAAQRRHVVQNRNQQEEQVDEESLADEDEDHRVTSTQKMPYVFGLGHYLQRTRQRVTNGKR